MPQTFEIVRCYQCSTFQVKQLTKSTKWQCKLCGEKQSLKKVYFEGSGAECRVNTQQMNMNVGKTMNKPGYSSSSTAIDLASGVWFNSRIRPHESPTLGEEPAHKQILQENPRPVPQTLTTHHTSVSQPSTKMESKSSRLECTFTDEGSSENLTNVELNARSLWDNFLDDGDGSIMAGDGND